MNAEQAKEMAKKHNLEAENSQYVIIMKMIKESASKGEYSCIFNRGIVNDVKMKLEEEGYKIIEHNDIRVGTTVTIKWNG